MDSEEISEDFKAFQENHGAEREVLRGFESISGSPVGSMELSNGSQVFQGFYGSMQ